VRRPHIAVLAAGLLLLLACTHRVRRPDPSTLKPKAEDFHQRVRWRDYRGASELIVPERREAFTKARQQRRDDRDLTITDYQLEGLTMLGDGHRAKVVSKVSWLLLPSATEQEATITSEFVYRDGDWLLARQDAGPFAEELEAEYEWSPDAGTP
jgi:hypothetical protein